MALKKSLIVENSSYIEFNTLDECLEFYKNEDELEKKYYAIEKMVEFSNGADELVKLLEIEDEQKITSFMGSVLAKIEPEQAPIEAILELLNSENAFIRNLAISILRDYGKEIKYYIVKYLLGEDRDLRIFAINVLGDVEFAESRDMLIELLENEADLNVAMTAVDYLAEIGEIEDIGLLESLKDRFNQDPYVEFGVNSAIKSIEG